MRLPRHSRCLRWSVLGAALGASTAWAQSGPPPELVSLAADSPVWLLVWKLAEASPFAAIVGFLAWQAARMGPPTVRIVVVEDEATLRKRLDELERRLQGER